MNKCTETQIQEMLPDLLHGSLDDGARRQVESHLATCESCREDLDVIRTVKTAAVFAPAIDVDRVVRQIAPYRMIVPSVEKPTRGRMLTWLVAAGLILGFVGGGSLVLSRQQRTAPSQVAITNPPPAEVNVAKSNSVVVPVQATKAVSEAAVAPRGLALASDIEQLSDDNLVQLMNDMDQFDALPAAEPEPVIAVDTGDSL
jgi:anti-sigma factor RsiW